MRNKSVITDEADDIFATSESDPSPSDGNRQGDEDFIADDEEPTIALDPREQQRSRASLFTPEFVFVNHFEKVKGDVDSSLLDAVQAVLRTISTKFVLGLEVGIRAFYMHI